MEARTRVAKRHVSSGIEMKTIRLGFEGSSNVIHGQSYSSRFSKEGTHPQFKAIAINMTDL